MSDFTPSGAGPNAAMLAARLSGRPMLMTEAGAREYAMALMRQAGAPAPHRGGLGELLGWMRGAKSAKPSDKTPKEAEAPAPPRYAAHWMPAVQAEGYGWSLIDGVAVVRIDGPLMDQGFYSEWSGWVHGYDTLSATFADIAADDRVKGVWIRARSPGGIASNGLPELVGQLRELDKPVWTWCEYAYSAMYWLASPSVRIVGGRLSGVGSIGAVATWCGMAGFLEQEGFELEHIQFGAKKTDGSPFKSLSDSARADWQADIDQLGGMFVDSVVENRPGLSREAVLATEAGCYLLEHDDKTRDAVAVGLADAVMTERECFFAFAESLSAAGPTPDPTGDPEMKRSIALKAAKAAKLSPDQLTAFQAALNEAEGEDETPSDEDEEEEAPAETAEEAPPADDEPGDDEEGSAEASARAPKAGMETAKAILALPEAKGRGKLAQELAFQPGMTVASAKRLLAAAGKESSLSERMTDRDPKVTPGGGSPSPKTADRLNPSKIYSRRNARGPKARSSAA